MSVSSTFTTVAQNGDSPSHAVAGLIALRSSPSVAPEEVAVRQPEQVAGADQLHERHLHQVHGQQDRDDPEEERAEDAVAQRLALLVLGQARAPGWRAPARCRR